MRANIPNASKVRSELQKEISSVCPLGCGNTDVGHFQIHHIDEKPDNNDIGNLLLVCPTCHSKITKGDISRETVEQIKKELPVRNQIEWASIAIDSKNCSWVTYDDAPNAFIQNDMDKSSFPILNFSFINHSSKTILMKEIHLKAKHLYSGLSGIPRPRLLKTIKGFPIELPNEKETTVFKLIDEIEVPSGQAFKIQVQLYTHEGNETYPIDGRKVLYFTIKFNNNISIKAPTIFLNCKSENEGLKIEMLD